MTTSSTIKSNKRTMSRRRTVVASCGLASVAAVGYCVLLSSSAPMINQQTSRNYTRTTDEPGTKFTRNKNGRTFLGYTSSAWEEEWLNNLDAWQDERSICDHVLSTNEWPKMMKSLEATCNRFPVEEEGKSPWCIMDDNYSHRHGGVYYNRETGQLAIGQNAAPDLASVEFEAKTRPLDPSAEYEDVLSKFTYRNEGTNETYDEYIEPLVSHLRHPLAKCAGHPDFAKHVISGSSAWSWIPGLRKRKENMVLTLARGYLIPPPPPHSISSTSAKTYLFDAGASNWFEGAGGPSLSVLTELFERNGRSFDDVRAFEGSTSPETFDKIVPQEWKDKTTFQQAWIRSRPDVPATSDASLDGPFLPTHIASIVTKDDYVVFKLDIDSPEVEGNTVLHLLSDEGAEDLSYIDEFFWEHHVTGNYLMRPNWGIVPGGLSIRDSAELFLRLRRRGVRAHSWV